MVTTKKNTPDSAREDTQRIWQASSALNHVAWKRLHIHIEGHGYEDEGGRLLADQLPAFDQPGPDGEVAEVNLERYISGLET